MIYTGPITAGVAAEVELKVAADGTIVASKLARSSGVPEWDQAVLRAIERTEVLHHAMWTDGFLRA